MKTKEQIQKEGVCAECGGEVFTTEEFAECIERGTFIPYDGVGYFHDGENETWRSVWDDSVTAEEVEKYPYVCWYNR